MTALELLTQSLRLANVIDEVTDPSAEQGAAGLTSLNQLMAQWDGDGIKLGWYVLPTLATTVPLDVQDERGVKYNFAVELCGEYGIEPLPRVERIAKDTKAELRKRHRKRVECKLDMLPDPDHYPRAGSISEGG